MNCYGFIEVLLSGFITLIFLDIPHFEALPLSTSNPEALASSPAATTTSQVHGDAISTTQHEGPIFKVFPKKNRVELRPNGPVAPLGHTRSPRRRTTAGRRILHKQGESGSEESGSGESGSGESGSERSGSEGSDAGGSGSGGSGSGGSGSGGNSTNAGRSGKIGFTGKRYTNAENELVVSVPSYQTNARGEIINREIEYRFQRGPFEPIEKNPVKKYFPSLKNLTTVCINKSTIYNDYKIEKWLPRSLTSKKKSDRPILIKLRREIFDQGESELCHSENYTDWQRYQECAIRRNQRLEYLIPNYPRQQVVLN